MFLVSTKRRYNGLRRFKVEGKYTNIRLRIHYETVINVKRKIRAFSTNVFVYFSVQFDRDGLVIIDNFLSEKQLIELKDAGAKMTQNVPVEAKTVFTANSQNDKVKTKKKKPLFFISLCENPDKYLNPNFDF